MSPILGKQVRKGYADNLTLVAELAASIAASLSAAIALRGRATLAVSGGSTPRTLFDALARIDIEWSLVVVTLVDERWVPESDPASNALLVHRHLLQGLAAKATLVGLKTAAHDPFAAATDVDARLREQVLPPNLALDVAVLGMGEDGHTASFFKDAEGLEVALSANTSAVCCGIRPPRAPHARMTLTLNTLLRAERLLLHVIGESKWLLLQTALQPGPVNELPVRALLQQDRVLLEIYQAAD